MLRTVRQGHPEQEVFSFSFIPHALLRLAASLVVAVVSVGSFIAYAQPTANASGPLVFVCIGIPSGQPPARSGLNDGANPPVDSQAPALRDCQHFRPSGAGNPVAVQPTTSRDLVDRVRANGAQWVLVRFADDGNSPPVPIASTNLQKVIVRAGGVEIRRTAADGLIDPTTIAVPLKDFDSVPNGTTVTVEVSFDPRTPRAASTSYFTLINHVTPYGLAKTGSYLWLPVALFATNFRGTDEGIPLSAFPVGLAAGLRLYPSDSDGYLGISAMANWAIYSSTSPEDEAGARTSSFNVQSIAVGGLVDINNMVYMGGAYLIDFRSNRTNPGGVFVVGAGPGLLQFLQAAK